MKPLSKKDINGVLCDGEIRIADDKPYVNVENVLSAKEWLKKELEKLCCAEYEGQYACDGNYYKIKDLIDEAFNIE